MRRREKTAAIAALALALVACLGGSGPGYLEDESPKTPPDLNVDDGGFVKSDVDIGDPFAIEGVTPSHGPFSGKTRVTIGGRGFSSKLRVFFGATEASVENLLASDATRVAFETPPGPPGFVDVRIRDESTSKERVLPNGFYYDAFVVEPSSGATSGGTRIALTGSGTTWTDGTKVAIAGAACNDVVVKSATRIECVTPAGTPGAKDVTVTTPDNATIQAREAYTYSDSVDGYRGGLSGGAFAGRLKVLAFDGYVGTPIAGAQVIVGPSLATAVVKQTTASGVVEIDDLPGTMATVTVAAKCHQPVTFVDVPVDTVTVYMNPVLDLSCAEGDPPSTGGGGGRYGGLVEGQLIFPGAGEFEKAGWTTVPNPTRPTERRAAYAFYASATPTADFELPAPNLAITPDSPGAQGFGYSLVVFPGNVTVYVIAGLEDRSEDPPRFTPYAMGVTRGVTVPSQTRVQGVDVKMDILFDHEVELAPALPTFTNPRGPDRLSARVSLTLGAAGYAILPAATRVAPLPFPATGTLPFVGMPSLDHALSGEQYVLGAAAATGTQLVRPLSVVSRVRTSNANTPVTIGGFLGVPVLETPGAGTWTADDSAQALPVKFSGATGPVDLTVVGVESGNGLVTWMIVAPGAKTDFTVPDISKLPAGNYGLVSGAIQTTVNVARIDQFEYGKLRYGQLGQGAWNAYASDALGGAY